MNSTEYNELSHWIIDLAAAVDNHSHSLQGGYTAIHNEALGNIVARIAALENGGGGIPQKFRQEYDLSRAEAARRICNLEDAREAERKQIHALISTTGALSAQIADIEKRLTLLDEPNTGAVWRHERLRLTREHELRELRRSIFPRMRPDPPALRPEAV